MPIHLVLFKTTLSDVLMPLKGTALANFYYFYNFLQANEGLILGKILDLNTKMNDNTPQPRIDQLTSKNLETKSPR